MPQKYQILWVLMFQVFGFCSSFAQNVHWPDNKTRNTELIGASALCFGAGAMRYSERYIKPYTLSQVNYYKGVRLPELTLGANAVYRSQAARVSDGLLLSGLSLGAASVFWQTPKHRVQAGVQYVQGAAATVLLTQVAKLTVLRTRPYVYAYETSNDDSVFERDARFSFFSGHTSISAYGSFFAAGMYARTHPDSAWRPWVWACAAVLPAATGYLRVRAGKHFPSDVAVGYLAGASVALLNFHLHRPKKRQ